MSIFVRGNTELRLQAESEALQRQVAHIHLLLSTATAQTVLVFVYREELCCCCRLHRERCGASWHTDGPYHKMSYCLVRVRRSAVLLLQAALEALRRPVAHMHLLLGTAIAQTVLVYRYSSTEMCFAAAAGCVGSIAAPGGTQTVLAIKLHQIM